MEKTVKSQLEEISTTTPSITLPKRVGILPPGKTMEDYLGLSVINLSDIDLTEAQVSALTGKIELDWIYRLRTIEPMGLNSMC
jgi:hypothetical protein